MKTPRARATLEISALMMIRGFLPILSINKLDTKIPPTGVSIRNIIRI